MCRQIWAVRFVALTLITGIVTGCTENTPPAKVGISMAELNSQNRCPLDVVSFVSASGVGDLVMGLVLEQQDANELTASDNAASETNAEDIGDSASGTTGQDGAATMAVKVSPKTYRLTVSNISDCPVMGFQYQLTYTNVSGQPVDSNEITRESGYVANDGVGIQPGAVEALDVVLMTAEGATINCEITTVFYEDCGTKDIWTAPVADQDDAGQQ